MSCYMCHIWEKLEIKPALLTAHHSQPNRQTGQLNQELEGYLLAFVNYY